MNNKKRGIGLWVVVLVCVFIGIIVSEGWNLLTTSDYSYSDFQQDIQTKAEQRKVFMSQMSIRSRNGLNL